MGLGNALADVMLEGRVAGAESQAHWAAVRQRDAEDKFRRDMHAAEIELIKAKDYGQYAAPELGTLPVDYLSTVDITNGNSGSSTLNAKGEFVGLAFDGTIEGVVSDWMYDPKINRTIHVDSRFMLWTMDKVDGVQRLLTEMGVGQ